MNLTEQASQNSVKHGAADEKKHAPEDLGCETVPLSGGRKILAWGSYPLVMGLGMGFALWMAERIAQTPEHPLMGGEWQGMSWQLTNLDLMRYAMYLLPVLFAALWVYVMEKKQPFSEQWKPDWRENIRSDVGLFILNNVILRAEIWVAIAMGLAAGAVQEMIGVSLWPSDWPLLFQVLLFLLIAEFGTYWLHRLEHEWFPLWRIHVVHHNPQRLYWFNATRFHYVDIVAIPVMANVPAVAMGADLEVIYLATTASVMHGFWQHANADVRFGWLNYLVSSPELHRWHHMKDTALANHNYGSNLIVWDLVFGTWFLPENRRPEAGQVGVREVAGDGIWRQFLLPLTLKK